MVISLYKVFNLINKQEEKKNYLNLLLIKGYSFFQYTNLKIMSLKKNRLRFFSIISLLFVVILLTTSISNNKDFKIVKNLDIFYNLFRELNYWYVDDINPEELVVEGIDVMLKSLDPYNDYIPKEEDKDFKFMTTGKYGGIGSIISKRNDSTAIISEPYYNRPAHKAGLKPGDILLMVDSSSVRGLSLKEISNKLKGTPGTEVEVTIERPYLSDTLSFSIERKKISIKSVTWYGKITDSIGYIRLKKFTENSGKEVKEALKTLKKDSAKSIILDLRNNPGGLLNEAVNVTSVFVNKNQVIVNSKGKIEQFNKTYKTSSNPVDTQIPLAVLVNSNSASASEIVSGAIQDLDRGIVIGERTFGKGLVQSVRPLSYGSKLKVTTAKYYIPSGRCIQAIDYSHRKEDGSVGNIPDSLISEFKTKNNRTVFDGGGIVPDIKVEAEDFSEIAYNLFAQDIFFKFATKYFYSNDSIQVFSSLIVNDGIYNEFKDFVKEKKFSYKSATEKKLEELIDIAKKERYYKLSEEEIEALEEKLEHDTGKDLEIFKDQLSSLIKQELATRYFYQEGKLKAMIENDVQVEKAKLTLNDTEEYKRLLTDTSIVIK